MAAGGVPYKLVVFPIVSLFVIMYLFFSEGAAPLPPPPVKDKLHEAGEKLKVENANLQKKLEDMQRREHEAAAELKIRQREERHRRIMDQKADVDAQIKQINQETAKLDKAGKLTIPKAPIPDQQQEDPDHEVMLDGTHPCYFITGIGVGDRATTGYYFFTSITINDHPVYKRVGGAWLMETNYMAILPDKRWIISRSSKAALEGKGEVCSQGSNSDPSLITKWDISEGGSWRHVDKLKVIRQDAQYCSFTPEMDTVIEPNFKPSPMEKRDYFSTFDVKNPEKDYVKYKYPEGKRAFTYIEDMERDVPGLPYTIMSYIPKVYHFEKMMTHQECDEIMAAATALHIDASRSGVVPHKGSSESSISQIRTSNHVWLTEDLPAAKTVMNRIMATTGFGIHDHEALQVLRYEHMQKYDAHHDYFDPNLYGEQNTNRAVTCFLYLDDVEEGGETVWWGEHFELKNITVI